MTKWIRSSACALAGAFLATTLMAFPGATEQETAEASGLRRGEVLEVIDAGSYTYLRLREGKEERWVAGPKTAVAVGDEVEVPTGMTMENFESPSLGRTFDRVDFVGSILRAGGADDAVPALPEGHPPMASGKDTAKKQAPTVEPGNVEKAPGGVTVAEVYARKDALRDQEIVLRGRVVKVNEGIMGKNWLHLQDGTGSEGTNDLTVTTSGKASVGELVTVRGKLVLDKDFGFGYHYEVLLEDAEVEGAKEPGPGQGVARLSGDD